MTFAEKVYDAVSRIPKGRVATYGQIAEIIGCPGGARAVGNALHVNPFAPVVPCHRVVAADGRLAANFGGGGPDVQYARLAPEGVVFLPQDFAPSRESLASGAEFADYVSQSRNEQIPRVDLARCGIVIERHPLEPFLPAGGRILFLGSFPPPRARWSMDFFYPNWINDFWRIQGLIHFGDAHYFEEKAALGPGDAVGSEMVIPGAAAAPATKAAPKRFDRARIIEFCAARGLAFFDTAAKVCRWKGNASDEFLEILEPADVVGMLAQMPECHTIVSTGGKSAEELAGILAVSGALVASGASASGSFATPVAHAASGARPLSAPASGYPLPVPPVGSYLDLTLSGRPLRWWRLPSTSRAYPMPLAGKAEHYSKLF